VLDRFNFIKIIFLILAGAFFFISSIKANAEVDKDSILWQVRRPISELDLILYDIEKEWRQEVLASPIPESDFPNIVKAGVEIELEYIEDRILVSAIIHNLNKFLFFNEQERKKLVYDILQILYNIFAFQEYILVIEKGESLTLSPKLFEKNYLMLKVVFTPGLKDSEGDFISLTLPLKSSHSFSLAFLYGGFA